MSAAPVGPGEITFASMDPGSDSEAEEGDAVVKSRLSAEPTPQLLEGYDTSYPEWRSTPSKRVKTSLEILSTTCCLYGCNLMVSRHGILTTRMLLADVGSREKKASCFVNAVQLLTKPHTTKEGTFRPFIEGVRVCSNLFAQVVGITISRLYSILGGNHSGALVHGREGGLYPQSRTLEAVGVGMYQMESLGQSDPCSGILMPAGFSRSDFARECRPDETFKYARFRAITKKRLKFKTSDSHLRCSVCSLLARSLILNRGNISKRREIIWMRRLHYEDIRKERYLMKATEQMARAEPSRLAVLKHDTMGKDGTKLPSLVSRGKKITDGSRFPACLHAVQLPNSQPNGGKYYKWVYLNPASCTEGGTDYYASTLLHTLSEMATVPPLIIFHQDNCSANKSDAFFGFCSWILLQIEQIQEIRVVYSSVGHTHDSVDGFFGSLRKSLVTRDIHTVNDLTVFLNNMRCVHEVKTAPPVYNFSPLCGMTVAYEWKSSQHQFIFRRDGSGGVSFSYCRWLGNSEFTNGATGGMKEWPMFEDAAKVREAKNFMPTILPLRHLKLTNAIDTVLSTATPYLTPAQLNYFRDLPDEIDAAYSTGVTIADLLNRIRARCVPLTPASTVTRRATLNKFIEQNKIAGRPWQPIQPAKKRRKVAKK